MAPFRLELTAHAKFRMKQRSITRQQIRSALSIPDERILQEGELMIVRKQFTHSTLRVVYIPVKLGYKVVTAYWENMYP